MTTLPNTPADGFVVVGIDGSDEAVHALAWAVDHAVRRNLSVEVVIAWSFPTIGVELPASGRVLHRHALDVAHHAVAVVDADRHASGAPMPPVHVQAYLAQPADRLVRASREADLLVVGRGRRSLLGSTSRAVMHHATCPVAVIPAPESTKATTSLSTRLAADHPQVAAAIDAVARHFSAMGV